MITHKDMRKYLLAHDLPTNDFGNAAFFANVEYVSPLRKCNVETLVSFVLAGYCEGTVRLDPSEDLTQMEYMMNFTCAWHECKFDISSRSFVIRGRDERKMGGDFVITIRQL
ncbi:MAG: hypothetical protein QNK26_07325 [Moritella sp.]|uniref:hypothetical protein n=1 Tax=Moritella sp. TaxID=78556 RepID=UPI0029B62CC5|nr:hypothetical protein [Moritella sp.]MDX2320394.1 hypothetical protein [Moritella sp.]